MKHVICLINKKQQQGFAGVTAGVSLMLCALCQDHNLVYQKRINKRLYAVTWQLVLSIHIEGILVYFVCRRDAAHCSEDEGPRKDQYT